ncbi:CD1871A family CXXC motif-containing protein [Clostridium ihumii]
MKKMILKYSILAMSISFIVIGVYRDEANMVLQKAINICLECIGIG